MEQQKQSWIDKHWYLVPIGIFGGSLLIAGIAESSASRVVVEPTPIVRTTTVAAPVATPVQKQPATVPLSNNNYYTNTYGNSVHSPAYAPSVPSGASARCSDGTYSFSQSRSGTCSHHGGVSRWY